MAATSKHYPILDIDVDQKRIICGAGIKILLRDLTGPSKQAFKGTLTAVQTARNPFSTPASFKEIKLTFMTAWQFVSLNRHNKASLVSRSQQVLRRESNRSYTIEAFESDGTVRCSLINTDLNGMRIRQVKVFAAWEFTDPSSYWIIKDMEYRSEIIRTGLGRNAARDRIAAVLSELDDSFSYVRVDGGLVTLIQHYR